MSIPTTFTNNFTKINLISDGDVILHGESLFNIGSDTVILFNTVLSALYICAHLKDYKPLEDASGAFTKQMTSILNIVNANKDKEIYLMLDANTQFEIEGNTILVFSKNGEKERKKFVLDDGIRVSSIISSNPTSNKMRGVHTAQLNKSLEPVSATIDHIIVFNSCKVVDTSSYVVDVSNYLTKIMNDSTLTTRPNSIPDHSLVVSTLENGISLGTLNVKGGDNEDKACFEFVPEQYFKFFTNPVVMARLDTLLMDAFGDRNEPLEVIKGKNYLSTPRCGIFDIHLPSKYVPYVSIKNGGDIISIDIKTDVVNLFKNENNEYKKPLVVQSDISEWVDILIADLNSKNKNYERRNFLLEKGYMLLNYWHNVQRDITPLIEDVSLMRVYHEWYESSMRKVSISGMIRITKTLHPNLRVLSLQEMPLDYAKSQSLIDDILELDYSMGIYYTELGPGPTRGVIIVFHD
jgi:hypothetical protein